MEPPLARCVTRKSKERSLSGGMSSSVVDSEVMENMPSSSQSSSSKKLKQNEEMIDVVLHDTDDTENEDPAGVLVVDEKDASVNKGKTTNNEYGNNWQNQVKDAFSNDLSGPTSAPDLGSMNVMDPFKSFTSESHNSINHDGCGSDISYYDDGDDACDDDDDDCEGDYDYDDDCAYDDDYLSLQAQFDNVDLPPGVEATVSWLQDPAQSKNMSAASSSSTHTSMQTQCSAVDLTPGVVISGLQDHSESHKNPFSLNKTLSNLKFLYDDVHLTCAPSSSTAAMDLSEPDEEEDGHVKKFESVKQFEDGTVKKFESFKQFDTVQDYSDHHYTHGGSSMKQPPKNWAKKIQEEWKILEKDLPDTIFVRVYEARMDLLRAVIVGAAGTPYHDGLFFFDVFFPADYPNVPPQVYYYSGGLRLNPNLYECGKVCLSLLNTWSGNTTEKWIPGKSTMLQVLVSVQALILNAKPFFNEPGYENMYGGREGERKSDQYNEDTLVKSLQTMLYTLRRPPKHFEDFVAGHFRKHAHDILMACKAYMEGAKAGSTVGEVQVGDKKESCSHNFQRQVASKVRLLVPAFVKVGAKDCEQFLPLVEKLLKKGS